MDTPTTTETIQRLLHEARALRDGFRELGAVADDLECLAAELAGRQARTTGVCAYCGHRFDIDLHHDDPAQDDHWPDTELITDIDFAPRDDIDTRTHPSTGTG